MNWDKNPVQFIEWVQNEKISIKKLRVNLQSTTMQLTN